MIPCLILGAVCLHLAESNRRLETQPTKVMIGYDAVSSLAGQLANQAMILHPISKHERIKNPWWWACAEPAQTDGKQVTHCIQGV